MNNEISQYMTFKLGNEVFAINVAQVREVLEVPKITKMPGVPDYMLGVVHVRGKAIPVADLRRRLGLPPAAETLASRIIVMELTLEGQHAVLGGLADSVHEVIELDPATILPPPALAMRWRTEVIRGMGRRGDDFLIILDVDAVFASDQVALAESGALVEEVCQ